MKRALVLTLICAVMAIWSCTEAEQQEKVKPLNPNGDSELALLMRSMFDEGVKMKEQVLKGEQPSTDIDFEKILTADPTDPEQIDNDLYRAFGQAYINSMKALIEQDGEGLKDRYSTMVGTCVGCHNSLCPGPLVRINKLLLEAG